MTSGRPHTTSTAATPTGRASPIRVAIVDLRLRSGSGTTVIRRLRRGGSTACIVVITASVERRDHAAALDAGADAVLDKVGMTSTMVDDLAALVAGGGVSQPCPPAHRAGRRQPAPQQRLHNVTALPS